MREALSRGQWVWRPPLGYLPDGKSMKLDPERAPLVRFGFERSASGLYTRAQVLQDMTDRGLRTLKGRELTAQKWGEMLTNQLYIARISQPAWEIETAGNWPPLVEDDAFWKCQGLLRGEGLIVARERNHPDSPLRGFMTCGHCGKPLTGSWSQGKTRREDVTAQRSAAERKLTELRARKDRLVEA